MICDVCGKNQATVHLTEIIDEQMNELHLCEECARHKSAQMEQQFGLSDILAGMAEFEKPSPEKESVAVKCPNCKLTYADFKKVGRLGCGECYTAFKKFLSPLLKRIHGANQHFGKIPPGAPAPALAGTGTADAGTVPAAPPAAPPASDLAELRAKLQKAIESEAFEDAAKLRDQIRELERRQSEKSHEEPER